MKDTTRNTYSVLTPAEIEDLEIYVLGKKTK